jgi:flagellar biosynthesis/type III secretory pathway M-ring protein FliF/YscJ
VKRAAGYSIERGDSVHVSSASFARIDTDADTQAKAVAGWKQWIAYIAAGGLALIVLAVWVVTWRRKKKKARQARTLALTGDGFQSPELAAQINEAGELTGLPGGAVPSLEGRATSHHLDGPMLRAKALQLASEDPATAAIIIRKWLNAGVNTQATAR